MCIILKKILVLAILLVLICKMNMNHFKKVTLQMTFAKNLTLSWRTSLWYRIQFIDLICKLMGSFLYDRDLRLERVKWKHGIHCVKYEILSVIYSLIWIGKGSCSEVFCIKGVLEKFAKFSGKHLCQSLFLNKVAGLIPATSLKKDSDAGVFL